MPFVRDAPGHPGPASRLLAGTCIHVATGITNGVATSPPFARKGGRDARFSCGSGSQPRADHVLAPDEERAPRSRVGQRPLGMFCGRPSVTLQAPAPTWVRAFPTPHVSQRMDGAPGPRDRGARANRLPPRRRPTSHDARPERGLRNPRPTSRNRRQQGDRGAFRPDGPHPSQEADKAEALPQQAVRGLVTRTETTTISARVRQSLRMRCTTDQRIQHTCGIPAPNMARPGLEPGTPRFSVVRSGLAGGAQSLEIKAFVPDQSVTQKSAIYELLDAVQEMEASHLLFAGVLSGGPQVSR